VNESACGCFAPLWAAITMAVADGGLSIMYLYLFIQPLRELTRARPASLHYALTTAPPPSSILQQQSSPVGGGRGSGLGSFRRSDSPPVAFQADRSPSANTGPFGQGIQTPKTARYSSRNPERYDPNATNNSIDGHTNSNSNHPNNSNTLPIATVTVSSHGTAPLFLSPSTNATTAAADATSITNVSNGLLSVTGRLRSSSPPPPYGIPATTTTNLPSSSPQVCDATTTTTESFSPPPPILQGPILTDTGGVVIDSRAPSSSPSAAAARGRALSRLATTSNERRPSYLARGDGAISPIGNTPTAASGVMGLSSRPPHGSAAGSAGASGPHAPLFVNTSRLVVPTTITVMSASPTSTTAAAMATTTSPPPDMMNTLIYRNFRACLQSIISTFLAMVCYAIDATSSFDDHTPTADLLLVMAWNLSPSNDS
jgi:hypothetical protein